jgi:ketosteroid isomerase-like protein
MIEDWIAGWTEGWRNHDPDAIAALYTTDAIYVSHPFREPEDPRAYAERVFGEEESAEFRFGKPVVDGDQAVVEYWAVIQAEGREQSLAGVTMLRFAEDGRCCEHRDYWALEDGRREPPPGWGYTVP